MLWFMKARFFIYGLLGWGLEVFWTGLISLMKGDHRLRGQTYLWMFPIYGLAILFEPVHNKIRSLSWFIRGLIWLVLIWTVEYISGGFIRMVTGSIPWDYTGTSPWQISGLIRLDMAPLWFIAGLFFERVHDFLVKFGLGEKIKGEDI